MVEKKSSIHHPIPSYPPPPPTPHTHAHTVTWGEAAREPCGSHTGVRYELHKHVPTLTLDHHPLAQTGNGCNHRRPNTGTVEYPEMVTTRFCSKR